MELTTAARRLLACAGGMLTGGVLGAELIAPDGSVKGLLAGLGVGVMVAALVRDGGTQVAPAATVAAGVQER